MNFALILFLLTVFTGIIWLFDRFVLAKQRIAQAEAALARFDSGATHLDPAARSTEREKLRQDKLRHPAWVEYTGGFFPVIAAVFLLRSFVAEPFRIPSGSMIPTLLVGDLILVNKYAYGVRLPVLNTKIIEVGEPRRGDVMVFRYPKDESQDYIKRVIGIPGDKIVYENKHLTVNGQSVVTARLDDYFDPERIAYSRQYSERMGAVEHRILVDEARSPEIVPDDFRFRELCSYNVVGFRCTVPDGYYFMMGDNRDNSLDSRYWGFVPERNIVGKAFFIWMNFGHWSRIGGFN